MRKCLRIVVAYIGLSLANDAVCMDPFMMGFADYYRKEHNIYDPGLPIHVTGKDIANYLDLNPEKNVYELIEMLADTVIDSANGVLDPRQLVVKAFWELTGWENYGGLLTAIGAPATAAAVMAAEYALAGYAAFTSWIRFNSIELDASDIVYKEFTKDGDIWGAIVADRYGDGCTLL